MPTPEPQKDRVRNTDLDQLDDVVEAPEPLKQHGDALRDGSGSRQGERPDAARDAVPVVTPPARR